jgi:hypothetical protein
MNTLSMLHGDDLWTPGTGARAYQEAAALDLIALCGAQPTAEAREKAMRAVDNIAAHIALQRLAELEETVGEY